MQTSSSEPESASLARPGTFEGRRDRSRAAEHSMRMSVGHGGPARDQARCGSCDAFSTPPQ